MPTGPLTGGQLVVRQVKPFDANIAIADKLPGKVAAAMNLQCDAPASWVAYFCFSPFHELHAVNPGCDRRRIATDARSQRVPLTMTPEARPVFGQNGQRDRRRIGTDGGDLVQKCEIANRWFPADSLAVDSHQVAARVVIDHRLPGFAIFGAAEEEAAIGS